MTDKDAAANEAASVGWIGTTESLLSSLTPDLICKCNVTWLTSNASLWFVIVSRGDRGRGRGGRFGSRGGLVQGWVHLTPESWSLINTAFRDTNMCNIDCQRELFATMNMIHFDGGFLLLGKFVTGTLRSSPACCLSRDERKGAGFKFI